MCITLVFSPDGRGRNMTRGASIPCGYLPPAIDLPMRNITAFFSQLSKTNALLFSFFYIYTDWLPSSACTRDSFERWKVPFAAVGIPPSDLLCFLSAHLIVCSSPEPPRHGVIHREFFEIWGRCKTYDNARSTVNFFSPDSDARWSPPLTRSYKPKSILNFQNYGTDIRHPS